MSGGIAYVYDVDGRFTERVNYEMVDLEELDDDDVAFLRTTIERHHEYTGSAVAARLLANFDHRGRSVQEGDADRLQAGPHRDEGVRSRRARRGRDRREDHGSGPRLTERAATEAPATSRIRVRRTRGPTTEDIEAVDDRVLEVGADDAEDAAGAGASARLEGGLRAVRRRRAQPPGRPVHGLRHPVLQQRLPARQPDPGLERPGLPRPVARGDRSAARDQQLPGVHRTAVSGAVRVGVRARDQPGPGDDQADRGRDHRPGVRRGLGHPTGARRCAPASGWP